LPPFELSKAENHFQKAEIDRNFIIRKQKKSRKYIFDVKLCLSFQLQKFHLFLWKVSLCLLLIVDSRQKTTNYFDVSESSYDYLCQFYLDNEQKTADCRLYMLPEMNQIYTLLKIADIHRFLTIFY